MPGGSDQPDRGDYACAQAWTALSTAHALVTGELTAALETACGLSINEFELLLRVAHGGGRRPPVGGVGHNGPDFPAVAEPGGSAPGAQRLATALGRAR